MAMVISEYDVILGISAGPPCSICGKPVDYPFIYWQNMLIGIPSTEGVGTIYELQLHPQCAELLAKVLIDGIHDMPTQGGGGLDE